MHNVCPNCGQPVTLMARRCGQCGASFTLRRAFPPGGLVSARRLALGAALAALVTAIAGFTLLLARPSTAAPATPTATARAVPPLLPGYTRYTDAADGFTLQYPSGWTATPIDDGVEFDAPGQHPADVVQVLLPPPASRDATAWVQQELANLQQTAGAIATRPDDAQTSHQIGGESWAGDAVVLQSDNQTISVQVFAAIHQQRAYLVNLFAATGSLTAARATVFDAMLATFAFLAAP